MTLDLTSFDFALKEYYTADEVQNMVYKNNPFTAMVPKDENFYGDSLPVPVIYGNPQGRSASFARAQANVGSSKGVRFLLTRAKDYSIAQIDNETLEASQNDKGAFMEAATTEIDGAIQAATRSLSWGLFGDSGGTIGQLAASTVLGNSWFILRDIEQITNFEVGMVIKAYAAKTAGAARANTVTVTAVNRDTGRVDVSAALASLTGITVNDYIAVDGDYDAKVSGLDAWLPSVAPTAGDSHFGVDRSADVTRLSGVRVDGSALPIEEALITGASRIGREGGRPDCVFMNFEDYEDLEKALGTKVQYIDHQMGEIMFTGIKVNGPRGIIKVIPDQNCLPGAAFMLQLDTWKLRSLKSAVRILMQDGNKMLRVYNADSVEVRVGGYYQLACKAPGWNGRIQLR